jgi:hypothetical protein
MKKVFVNGNRSVVRTLSPFAYKDPIKTLDKSNEARVTLDGVRVFRSAVTSGRDVKNVNGGLKFHLYFYSSKEAAEARDTSRREFFPITSEEFRAYKDDPAYTIVLETADPVATLETEVVPEPVAAAEPETEVVPATVEPETEVVPEPEAGNGSTTRKAKRR